MNSAQIYSQLTNRNIVIVNINLKTYYLHLVNHIITLIQTQICTSLLHG